MPEQEFDIILEPKRSSSNYWRDIWTFRGLFYFLTWRDVLVRYKQTFIGFSWSIIRPLLTLVVFTIVFGKLAGLPGNGVPYALLVTAGLIPWQFFSNAFTEASGSLIGNSGLLSKVYFPRLIIPTSAVLVAIVDFLISLLILSGLMIWYRFSPGVQILLLPVFLIPALLVSLGAGFLVSALNVEYRDFRYIVPFVVQFGLYISPVGFSSTVIPDKYMFLYYLNPMAGVIDGFRWCILGGTSLINWTGFLISMSVSVVLFLSGLYYFRKMEKGFADVI